MQVDLALPVVGVGHGEGVEASEVGGCEEHDALAPVELREDVLLLVVVGGRRVAALPDEQQVGRELAPAIALLPLLQQRQWNGINGTEARQYNGDVTAM